MAKRGGFREGSGRKKNRWDVRREVRMSSEEDAVLDAYGVKFGCSTKAESVRDLINRFGKPAIGFQEEAPSATSSPPTSSSADEEHLG